MKRPLEQITDILTDLKNDIDELKMFRDNAEIPEYREEYNRKVIEKVNDYNLIIDKIG